DMVMGMYYLTLIQPGAKGEGSIFADEDEAIMAYQLGYVSLQAKVKVRRTGTFDGEPIAKTIDTTVGRVILNQSIPQNLGYVDRTDKEHCLDLEIEFTVDKKQLSKIIERCFQRYDTTRTATMLDEIKRLGFMYSTRGAITVSVSDMTVPKEKPALLAKADEQVSKVQSLYNRGLLSNAEREKEVISIWDRTTKEVTEALMNGLDEFNPIYMMATSGARGSTNQIRQLAGMRGLMADPSGKIIELPIRANFRDGLTVLEFFISSHGARKGLADTALRTADSGYLTRRLVDVSQDVIVREDDCFAAAGEPIRGITVSDIKNGNEIIEPLVDRLVGRTSVETVVHPETGEVLVEANEMISQDAANAIVDAGIEEVQVRSVLTCRAKHGVCSKCYGANLANGQPVNIGEAVGIIAAQSIGEPGTQLTMRTFHTGGVASAEDIT
ncbi:MAG: DNA-directed RNA polymerase subunit beta', partial [Acutalibacteraceae bacterium]